MPHDDDTPRTHRLTRAISAATGALGSFPAILLSFSLVTAWFIGGLFVQGGFGNNTYQLLINTGTTIVTFWMVFIIQNTQNREGRALQVKLDAIMLALDPDHSNPTVEPLLGIEDEPESNIKDQQAQVRDT